MGEVGQIGGTYGSVGNGKSVIHVAGVAPGDACEVQYDPEIKVRCQKQCRRKPKPIARGTVAKELGKIV